MKKMRTHKGFTVLELVVVIAIMGTITAITIPTIRNVNYQAKHTTDQSIIRSLNSQLAIAEVDANNENRTFNDAIKVVTERGFSIDSLYSTSGDTILWSENTNRFLLESDKNTNYPDVTYWRVSDNYDENNQQYSLYATSKLEQENIDNLTTGFDVGESAYVKTISYKRDGGLETQTVKITTNTGMTLNVDAPNDVVKHYGEAKEINIINVKKDSFHGYGSVKTLSLGNGRYILEKTGYVEKLKITNKNAIFASTLKKFLPNILIEGARQVRLQIVTHNDGIVLGDYTAYINNAGRFILDILDGDTSWEKNIDITQLNHSQVMALNLLTNSNINASITGDFTYQNDTYPISGNIILNAREFEDISYQANLEFDLGFKEISTQITKISSGYYLTVNDQHYYTSNNNLAMMLEMFNEVVGDFNIPSDFFLFVVNQVESKLNGMAYEVNEDEIIYTCNLMDDLSPIIFKSDLDHNLQEVNISNLESDGYNFNLKATVNNLASGHIDIDVPNRQYTSLALDRLDDSTINGITTQLKSIFTDKELGASYNIEVRRDNNLTFTTSGALDMATILDNGEEELLFSLAGNMVNHDADHPLNSVYNISMLDDDLYFSYQNRLKLHYTRTGYNEVKDIIKGALADNEKFQEFANIFMPDNSSQDAPILDIVFNTHNYKELLKYFNGISYQNNNLVIHFDASLLGGDTGDILFTFNTNNNGLSSIEITNVQIYGFTLNGSISLRDYQTVTVNDKANYTQLDGFNRGLSGLLELLDDNKANLGVGGSFTKDGQTTSFSGSVIFKKTQNIDWGVGNIIINDKEGRSHDVTIDVTKDKVNESNSEILFNYNNNMKGYLKLSAISEIYDQFYNAAHKAESRLDKYKSLLLSDISRSTLAKLLQDEIEAILYDDMITSITKNNDGYTIKLNSNFLQKNDVYKSDYIYFDVKLDNAGNFKTLVIRSDKMLDYSFNISITRRAWPVNENQVSRLSKDSSYKNFRELETLTDYLLNTANNMDFTISGKLNIDLKIIGFIKPDVKDIDMNAYVHIEKDANGEEKVYSQVKMNIPYYGSTYQNEKEWAGRNFYIYFTDTEVYLRTETWRNSSEKSKTCYSVENKKILGVRWDRWQKNTTKWDQVNYEYKDVKLTMDEFFSNVVYYVFNFGFDIEKDLSKYTTDSSNIDYSNLLNSYSYTNDGTPTWNANINMEELTTKDIFSDLGLTLKGNTSNKTMNSITATLNIDIIKVIQVYLRLDASLTSTSSANTSLVNNIKGYLSAHGNQNNTTVYNSTGIEKHNITVSDDGLIWLATVPVGYDKI